MKIVYELAEFLNVINAGKNQLQKTLFVINDPIGKESIDEIPFNFWQKHEETLKSCIEKVKLLMSCRKYILSDGRVKGLLTKKSNIVDIDSDQLKLSKFEKKLIWNTHSLSKELSEKEFADIFQNEAYFPLLCKLYFCYNRYQADGLRFFKEPVAVFKKEIRDFKTFSKEKYCALVLLVLFNNVLCVDNLLRDRISKDKYLHVLKLCGMKRNTAPHTIFDTLESMRGFFVKKIGNSYYFNHDFLMEVTTFLFGSDYPAETIKYADTGFLRRRVKLESFEEQNDPFFIYLSEKHNNDLGERLFIEIFGERLLDVVLNASLKNTKVINIFIEKLQQHPEKINMLLEKKTLQINKEECYQATKHLCCSKLSFLDLEKEISPLCALIAFCHTQISIYCLKVLVKMQKDINDISLFSAVCCNGSLDLLDVFLTGQVKSLLAEKWGNIYPIHIASVFHNYDMLYKLIQFGSDVNLKTENVMNCCTPLIYAAQNETKENEKIRKEESSQTRRN